MKPRGVIFLPTRLALVIAATTVVSPVFAQPQGDWIADPRTGCKVWDPYPSPGHSITWTGDCANWLAQGHGILQWFNDGRPGERDEGEFQDGKQQGRGIRVFSNGSRYEGDFANGRREGYGLEVYADNGRYKGGWKDNTLEGHGVAILANGNRFEGEFHAGKPNGQGTYQTKNGIVSGNWANGCLKERGVQATFMATKAMCGLK
jgi:hypothetical protein